jgi:hypothetical protein
MGCHLSAGSMGRHGTAAVHYCSGATVVTARFRVGWFI